MSVSPLYAPSCFSCLEKFIEPFFKFECGTSKKAAQVAGTLFALLSTVIFVSALMVQYPTAAQTFFILYGLGAAVSLVTTIFFLVKNFKENEISTLTPVSEEGSIVDSDLFKQED